MVKIKVYIGADHRGFYIKEKLKLFLSKYYILVDLGNKKYDKDDDYPVYAVRVARAVSKNNGSFGILICGSGQGMCIAANKIKGIRAALAEHIKDSYSARKDDNSNILCLQADNISFEKSKKIIKKFIETDFNNIKRYSRRVDEIKKLEK